MEIPEQLKNLKFCRVRKKTKIPFEKDWTNKPYTYEEISKFENENYGVLCGYEDLTVIDCDDVELQKIVDEKLPKTFKIKTGSGGFHYYFFISGLKKKLILNLEDKHLGEVQSFGTQVIGPNSIHPNKNRYNVINDSKIVKITLEQLYSVVGEFIREEKKENKNKQIGELTQEIASVVNFKKLLESYGLEEKNGNWNCPFHKSEGGMCLSIDEKGIFNCFHCNRKGNIISFVSELEGITIKEAVDKLKKLGGIKYESISMEDDFGKAIRKFGNYLELAEEFIKIQPIHYDSTKIWWMWNFEEYKWSMIDETDLMNKIDDNVNFLTIPSKIKNEILESLRRVGRRYKPLEPDKYWIQFKNKIYDIKTEELFEASSKYFITNPIPWEIGQNENTPTIDKIFREWIVKEGIQEENYITTLYQITAYCLLAHMPIHRIFCLIGDGLNGKGTYLRLIEKLLGEENIGSTNLDILATSRFEAIQLYKKLVVMISEIDKGVFEKTSTIKGLTGDDAVRIEFKGKDGFKFHNYAKPLIACNILPETLDKSKGFFRRWTQIKFPNQFDEKQNILDDIPEVEYNNLCKKSIRILQNLLEAGEFVNDGSIEDREKKYEEHSNPINKFIKEFCETDVNDFIIFEDFHEKFLDYLNSQKYRLQSKVAVGKTLKSLNFEKKIKSIENEYGSSTTKTCILGLKWGDEI